MGSASIGFIKQVSRLQIDIARRINGIQPGSNGLSCRQGVIMKRVVSVLLLLAGVMAMSGAYACDGKGGNTKMPSGPAAPTTSGTTGT
jgi:hypothetical protein